MSVADAIDAVKDLGDVKPEVAAAFALGFVAGKVHCTVRFSSPAITRALVGIIVFATTM